MRTFYCAFKALLLLSVTASDATAAKTIEECCVVLDLSDMVANPPPELVDESIACEQAVWCQFRPSLNKYILSGAADTEHVSILWYPIVDGSVGLHYHGKTESVYSKYCTENAFLLMMLLLKPDVNLYCEFLLNRFRNTGGHQGSLSDGLRLL